MGHGQKLSKKESESEISVTQSFYVDRVVLTIDKTKCIGCDLCTSICPKEATTRAKTNGGFTVEVDVDKCVLCGACVPFCPTSAISLTLNGEPKNVLVEEQGLPTPMRKIEIDGSKCPSDCVKCAEACPVEAIRIGEGHEISVDMDKCLRCPWCVDACDEQAIVVNPMFIGSIRIDSSKCKGKEELYAQSCPTKAIKLTERGLTVDPRYCVFCGACTNMGASDAVDLRRTRVICSGGFSSVWSSALKKLLGTKGASREHDNRALKKLNALVEESRLK